MTFEFAKMGENLVHPPLPNINTLINTALTRPVRAFSPFAFITTEKDFPDISFWQGEVNFDVMASKTDTIIIRLGQNLWVDPQFANSYPRAKAKRMIRGLYDFYDDRISPEEQFERIKGQIGSDPPEMEVYIDWERSYGGRYRGLQNVVKLMKLIEAHYPQITCGLYTGYFWFRANSNPIANANEYNYLKNKPLWLAWYTNNPANVLVPAPWTRLTLWQYGTPAEDYGQVGTIEIDKNYFNGTLRDFYERYSSVEPVPGEPMYFRVVSASSNIRSSPGVQTNPDNDLGADNLLNQDIIETEDTSVLLAGVTWRKIKRWWRNGVQRTLPPSPTNEHWGAEKNNTGSIWFTSTIFNPPPPPSTDYIIHFKEDGTTQKYVRSE